MCVYHAFPRNANFCAVINGSNLRRVAGYLHWHVSLLSSVSPHECRNNTWPFFQTPYLFTGHDPPVPFDVYNLCAWNSIFELSKNRSIGQSVSLTVFRRQVTFPLDASQRTPENRNCGPLCRGPESRALEQWRFNCNLLCPHQCWRFRRSSPPSVYRYTLKSPLLKIKDFSVLLFTVSISFPFHLSVALSFLPFLFLLSAPYSFFIFHLFVFISHFIPSLFVSYLFPFSYFVPTSFFFFSVYFPLYFSFYLCRPISTYFCCSFYFFFYLRFFITFYSLFVSALLESRMYMYVWLRWSVVLHIRTQVVLQRVKWQRIFFKALP